MGTAKESQDRRTRLKAQGLCTECANPWTGTTNVCDDCREKKKQSRLLLEEARKGNGLCRCGEILAVGKKLCEKCLTSLRDDQTNRRAKHRILGVCLTCGREAVEGKTACQDCFDRAVRSTMQRYESNKLAGVCPFCGSDKPDGQFRCDICHDGHLKQSVIQWHRTRKLVLAHYGGKCVCCNDSTYEFLELDHINNDGKKHREEVGVKMFSWALKNDFPDILQVMCANCNRGRGKFGTCPHKLDPTLPNSKSARYVRNRRMKVIGQYGGKCVCCNEDNWAFLEFDHVNDDGNTHRLIVGNKILPWIVANNFPSSIQLSCSNCNKARALYGICPHQR